MIVDISVACGAGGDCDPMVITPCKYRGRRADDERRRDHADHQPDLLVLGIAPTK